MLCQHFGCQGQASYMVGYRKWCGIEVNVQAVCPEHLPEATESTRAIIDSHWQGYASFYDRKV